MLSTEQALNKCECSAPAELRTQSAVASKTSTGKDGPMRCRQKSQVHEEPWQVIKDTLFLGQENSRHTIRGIR